MSKRTKLKLQKFRMFLLKDVFNPNYIVRNILAILVFGTVIVSLYGAGMLMTNLLPAKQAQPDQMILAENDTEETMVAEIEPEEVQVAEVVVPEINLAAAPQMASGNSMMLAVGWDAPSADVEEHSLTMVTEGQTELLFMCEMDAVNVRESASTDAKLVDTLTSGMNGKIVETEGDWYKITWDDNKTGYVRSDLVVLWDGKEPATAVASTSSDSLSKPTTEATTAATVVTTTTAPTTTTATTTAPTTTQAPTTAVASETTEAPTTQAAASGQVTPGVTYRSAISLSEEDINLMAAVMTLECGGESYEGQLAVANVIVNRYLSGAYGSSMRDVLYAPYQFSVTSDPRLDSIIASGAQSSCVQAAREALSGTNNIGSFISFRPTSYIKDPSKYDEYTIIGNHFFF